MTDLFKIFHIVSATTLETLPFLTLGALIAVILEKWLPQDTLVKIVPKNPFLASLCGAGLGVVLPTCECGSVFIVRRLLMKGAPAPMAFTYMLAGPVVNPVSVLSTWTAYPENHWIPFFRILFVLVSALILSFFWFRKIPPEDLFRAQASFRVHCHCGHQENFWSSLVCELGDLFALMTLGSFLSASIRVLAPGGVWIFLRDNPTAAVPLMALLAFLFSICSEADAFVAATFVSMPLASHLAFLTVGPVLDIKLTILYLSTFSRKVNFALFLIMPLLLLSFSFLFQVFV